MTSRFQRRRRQPASTPVRTLGQIAGLLLLSLTLTACSVDLVLVRSGGWNALQDGVGDGLTLAWRAFSGMVAHPGATLEGMSLAINQWDYSIDLFDDELGGYLRSPVEDPDAFIYTSALLTVAAGVVILCAALFDRLLMKMPRLAWRSAASVAPSQPQLRRAYLLDRARNMRLEHRLGTIGRGWRRPVRRLGYLAGDLFSGLVHLLRQPVAFPIYLARRGARQINRRFDPLLRTGLRQLIYLLLPLSLLLYPWSAYMVSVQQHTLPNATLLAQVGELLEAAILQEDEALLPRRIDKLKQAFGHHRDSLRRPAQMLDLQLDVALARLATAVSAETIESGAIDNRIQLLFGRFGHWRLFMGNEIASGRHGEPATERSRLHFYLQEAALLEGLAKSAEGPYRTALLQARDERLTSFLYERCISIWNPGDLLNPLPEQHTCCGSTAAPLERPLPGCREGIEED